MVDPLERKTRNSPLSSVRYWRVPVIEILFIIIAVLTSIGTGSVMRYEDEISMFFQVFGFMIAPICLIQSLLLNKIAIGKFRYDLFLFIFGSIAWVSTKQFNYETAQTGFLFILPFLASPISAFLTLLRRFGALRTLPRR
ncbi:hypothetical protein [Corynebacterium sp. H130]|uniref:hypothetical protein n=1 Tax=Corynebacterium sp. H130 TaxID=3133444 RepID=UPI0030A764D8